MKTQNPQSLVLINNTVNKKPVQNNRYSNLKSNNENKNINNILTTKKNQVNYQTNNKTIKKVNPRLTIEATLNFKKKEATNNEDLNHFRYPTTVSTNMCIQYKILIFGPKQFLFQDY